MRFFASAAAATFLLLATPILAHADQLVQFEITGSDLDIGSYNPGDLDITFTLPQAPPDEVEGYPVNGLGVLGPIAVQRNGHPYVADSIFFYNALAAGGFTMYINGDNTGPEYNGFDFGGDQVYSGTDEHPVFLPGTYSLYGAGGTPSLTISDIGTTVTPEPASLALLGTGTLGMVGLLRRRISLR